HSDIAALRTLGVTDIRVVAPAPLLPDNAATLGVQPCATLADGLDDADVVIALRIQHERMQQALDISPADYRRDFGLTADNLTGLKPDALILHPGPINRGVEIDPDIAYGPQSVVLEQVRNGIAVRMAVMAMIVGARSGT
ncbi:MAG: aspartate carbamoyltransferase catalytic subunit, partial [Salinisphaeraceae bacterium]